MTVSNFRDIFLKLISGKIQCFLKPFIPGKSPHIANFATSVSQIKDNPIDIMRVIFLRLSGLAQLMKSKQVLMFKNGGVYL